MVGVRRYYLENKVVEDDGQRENVFSDEMTNRGARVAQKRQQLGRGDRREHRGVYPAGGWTTGYDEGRGHPGDTEDRTSAALVVLKGGRERL